MGNSETKQIQKAFIQLEKVKEFLDAPDDLEKLRKQCEIYFLSKSSKKQKTQAAALIKILLSEMKENNDE